MALIWKRQDSDDEFFTIKPGGKGPTVTREDQPFQRQEPGSVPPGTIPTPPEQPQTTPDKPTINDSAQAGAAPATPLASAETSSDTPAGKSGGFFGRIKSALGSRLEKTRTEFVDKIKEVIKAAGKVDDQLIDRIEEILIQADVGAETTMRIVDEMKEFEARGASPDDLLKSFKSQLEEIVGREPHLLSVAGHKPFVFLVIGVNGVGKTTTIGKLAAEFRAQAKRC